ncbi:MAG: MaoC/PaaZ C-terminal domain-containing protein [Myxococcota bacterium]
MPLNRELIGKVYSAKKPFQVTAEKIASYAQAYGDDNKLYFSSPAFAPPIFGYVVAFEAMLNPIFDPKLNCDLMKLVHGEHYLKFHRLIREGDEIKTKVAIKDIQEKSSGEIFILEMESVDNEDEKVLSSAGTFFLRGKRKEGGQDEKSKKEDLPQFKEKIFSSSSFIEEGMSKRYAEASGDRNPIHTDEPYAKSVGLPGIILHGICTLAIAQKAIIDELLGGDPARLKSISARFSGLVQIKDTITTEGGWLETPEELKQSLKRLLAFQTVNQRNEIILTYGRAEVI